MMTLALAVCAAALVWVGGLLTAAWLIEDEPGRLGVVAIVVLAAAVTITVRVVVDIGG